MYRKKTKKRQLRLLSVASLREPSPVDNRVHIRQDIIDELDIIKSRVDQILQSFEEESELSMPLNSAVSIPVKTLESLFKQHEALGARREKDLSSVKDFFKKCLERFFDEATITELNYSTGEHHIPDIKEFVSAVQNALQMVHQLRILNAQLVEKMSDALKRKDLQSQFGNAGDRGMHNTDHIITMYTNEALKCGRLEKAIKGMTEEVESLKNYNSYLMQKNETDKSKLCKIEISNRELKATVQKLRTELNSLKHKAARDAAISQQINYQTSRQFSPVDENENTQATPQAEPPRQTVIIPSTSQQREQKEQIPSGVVSKKQTVSAKHTSRLVEQQLNTVEELLIQGQKRTNLAEKEIANLANMTDETLNHKYRQQYNCLCEAVDVIIILLGREGSDKLLRVLNNATPSNVFGDKKQAIPINELADIMKSAASRVMLELKLFIKLKRRLAAIPSLSNRKTLLSNEEAKKNITELQKWLDKEVKGIDEEIAGSVQHYEEHKKEIETTQAVYFDQLSKRVDGTIQQLSKSMEKLEMPDNVEVMLGNFMTTIDHVNDNPASKNKPHTNPFGMETIEESKGGTNSVKENANWLSTLSIPAIDVIRKNVAGHLRTKHGVNISSTSWRTQAYKKKEQNYQENAPTRKFRMPSLAHCVDFSANNCSNKPPSKSPSEAIHFPSIHKKQPRKFSEILQQVMNPYATRHTPATANATRIFAHKASQKQQKALVTHALPHVENTAKLTGTKLEGPWHVH